MLLQALGCIFACSSCQQDDRQEEEEDDDDDHVHPAPPHSNDRLLLFPVVGVFSHDNYFLNYPECHNVKILHNVC